MGKKNNAAVWKQLEKKGLANIQAVEIETSAEDGVSGYVPSYIGSSKYVPVSDGIYSPTVEATIHGKDGSVQKRKIKSPLSFYKDPQKARQVANAEAQEMWKEAKQKGIPVIMHTGRHKQVPSETKNAARLQWEHQMRQKAAEDAYLESPKGRIAFALAALIMTAVFLGGCVGLVIVMRWLGM